MPSRTLSASAIAEVDVEDIRRAFEPLSSDSVPQSAVQPTAKTHTLTGLGIGGIGSALPGQIVTNEDLQRDYGMDPEWIEQRTGIRQRHRVLPGQSTSDLAIEAGRAAIANAGLTATDIDLVVVGTFTPDHRGTTVGCYVQAALGINAPAFDVQAACSGFMYALTTAGQFVATGNSKRALVIGADVVSQICNPAEKRVYPLFGDGAGAVVLQAGSPQQGLLSYQLGADGSQADLLLCPVGGSRTPATPEAIAAGQHFLSMEGRQVYKWAVQTVVDSIRLVADRSGFAIRDIDLFLLHQANIRIIDHAVKELGIDPKRVVNNVDRVGNTSAASIPLVLDDARQTSRLHRGDLVMMCGFGAGLTWGTGLFRW